jgi:hypothetical protein
VKIFQAPDTRELEKLPDPAVFVLRAIVQLECAAPDAVRRATNLSAPEVEDALRYGVTHEYLRKAEDRYFVTWNWFRAVTRFLQRRHLLKAHR